MEKPRALPPQWQSLASSSGQRRRSRSCSRSKKPRRSRSERKASKDRETKYKGARKLVAYVYNDDDAGCCEQCCTCGRDSSPTRQLEESSSKMGGFSDMARRVRKDNALKLVPRVSRLLESSKHYAIKAPFQTKSGKHKAPIDWYENTLKMVQDADDSWSDRSQREPRAWSGYSVSKMAEYAAIIGVTVLILEMARRHNAK